MAVNCGQHFTLISSFLPHQDAEEGIIIIFSSIKRLG